MKDRDFKIQINPIPKPRQTRSDKWKERPAVMAYRVFADELRLKYKQQLPPKFNICFILPMPDSWSEKKKKEMNGKPHQQRPDLDNLVKSIGDSLCEDDSYIYQVYMIKLWGYKGSIEIY